MLLLERAENEFALTEIVFAISVEPDKQRPLTAKEPSTFYSAVITHAYYTIFYSAKAYLRTKGIEIRPPEEHRKVLEAFTTFVESGELDVELLKTYKELLQRADELLGILKEEKKKRGQYTYKTLPQANQAPAKESLDNAKKFFRTIYPLCTHPKPNQENEQNPILNLIGTISHERADELREIMAENRAPSIMRASTEELLEEIERRRKIEKAV
jgi:uncharacterized protein (UPF0332 family)